MSQQQLENEERITELEVRATFQDRTVSDLDEVVRAFTARIEALERELKALKETVATLLGPGEEVPPADETPPHY